MSAPPARSPAEERREVLIFAAQHGRADVLATVLEEERRDPAGDVTALLAFQAVSSHGSNACSSSRGGSSGTALHIACRTGHVDLVRVLLLRGAPADLKDANGRTPFAVALAEAPKAKLPQVRSAFEAELFNRCASGDASGAEALVAGGVDVQSCEQGGYSPAAWAELFDQRAIARRMETLAHGAANGTNGDVSSQASNPSSARPPSAPASPAAAASDAAQAAAGPVPFSEDELADVQVEVRQVKLALGTDGTHLGLKGGMLQRYLLQLSEKENLLLYYRLQHGEPLASPPPAPSRPSRPAGGGEAAGPWEACAEERVSVRPPPVGPVAELERSSLEAVVTHMMDYEALPVESTRALRALASLAYADASATMKDDRALPQVLRLLVIHRSSNIVALAAMRALCNLAFDPTVALGHLAEPKALAAILSATVGEKEFSTKASEAAARIVAAEVPQGEDGSAPPLACDRLRTLSGFFAVAAASGEAGHAALLAAQLMSNEMVAPVAVARSFIAAAPTNGASPACVAANSDAATVARGWLSLATQLAALDSKALGLGDALLGEDAIRIAAGLMERHVANASVQLSGIDAVSALIGSRPAGLEAFAASRGMGRIVAALRAHGSEAKLQTKGLKALVCGLQWPVDVQQRSGFRALEGAELTMSAMSLHVGNAEVQAVAFETLPKYAAAGYTVDTPTGAGASALSGAGAGGGA